MGFFSFSQTLPPWLLTITLLTLPLLYTLFTLLTKQNKNTAKLPPSPRKLPIIGNLHQVRESAVEHLISTIAKSAPNPVDLSDMIFSVTKNVIGKIAFGTSHRGNQFEYGKLKDIIDDAMTLLSGFSPSDFFPGVGSVLDLATGLQWKLERCFKNLDTFFQKVLEEHLDPTRPKPKHEDIIDVMLGLAKDWTTVLHLAKDHMKAVLLVKLNKFMKRTESKKSHSWWWDSHISPKNSKWLVENLEDMDQSVKRMLKLIEEDGDSFAKKAEMYYQKRPELIARVEEFYRLYLSLAERYDHVTGELRKTVPSDLQSHGSGISDVGSEPASTWSLPDQKLTRRKSGPRAVGFEFFLGSGGSSSDLCNKEGDDSSTLDSDSESDDSSVNNYSAAPGNGGEQGLRRKIIELEVELRDVKEKLRMQQEENTDGSSRGIRKVHSEGLLMRITGYEEEMRDAREKLRLSEEEIARLKIEVQTNRSQEVTNDLEAELELSEKDVRSLGANLETEQKQAMESGEKIDGLKAEVSDPDCKIQTLEEELKITKEKLKGSEREIANLRNELENSGSTIRRLKDQLGSAQKDVATWKAKIDKEQREVSKLQDRMFRYKASLSDRNREIRGLKETVSNANQSLCEENTQLQAEITKLSKELSYLEDNLKEWEHRCQSLEEEIRRVKAGKAEMEGLLQAGMEQLKVTFKLEYDTLMEERDELNAKIATLIAEESARDDQIEHMDQHLKQLHMEHIELIAGTEGAHRKGEELRSRVRELEEEVEKQREVIIEGAEEKREAIRQLCFSLEHYRNGYHRLRQAFVGHKRFPVMAA